MVRYVRTVSELADRLGVGDPDRMLVRRKADRFPRSHGCQLMGRQPLRDGQGGHAAAVTRARWYV